MPRKCKDAYDWSLTFSPEEDVKEIPGWFEQLIRNGMVTHCFAITERHTNEDKWHIHIAFRLKRSYNSDYKWWDKLTTDTAPALEIHYHDTLAELAGGYLYKSGEENVEIIRRFGFTDEGLALGQEFFHRGLMRERILKFTSAHVNVSHSKWNAVKGCIIAETGCKPEEVNLIAAQMGFTSALCKADDYKDAYLVKQLANQL